MWQEDFLQNTHKWHFMAHAWGWVWTVLCEFTVWYTVYPKKYAHGFVVLCFVVVMQSFIMNSHEVFIHIHQVALLALGQSLDCHSASEVSLMDIGKSVNVKPQQSTAKQKPCACFLGYTVHGSCMRVGMNSSLWVHSLIYTYIYISCALVIVMLSAILCCNRLCYRDHFVDVPSQWEIMLQCNIVSKWLRANTKLSLVLRGGSSISWWSYFLKIRHL